MKVELHLHTSRYSACSVNSPEELMRKLIAAGYDAVYLTEHDAFWPDREIAALQAQFPRLRILPGAELSIGTADAFQHLVVLGANDLEYLVLASGTRPDVGGILAKARAAGHLTVLAHPFRWADGADMLWRGHRPDAMELRTCNQDADQAELARQTADELHMPVVNAGDVHSVGMVGRFWIETACPLDAPQDIRRVVLGGQYVNRIAPGW
jgi:predicted metal-dependent phosphoesterase TrpH